MAHQTNYFCTWFHTRFDFLPVKEQRLGLVVIAIIEKTDQVSVPRPGYMRRVHSAWMLVARFL